MSSLWFVNRSLSFFLLIYVPYFPFWLQTEEALHFLLNLQMHRHTQARENCQYKKPVRCQDKVTLNKSSPSYSKDALFLGELS